MEFKNVIKFYKKLPVRVKLHILTRMILIDMDRLFKYFPESIKLIEELACGYGITSFMAASKYKHCLIRAYDINKNKIDLLESINPYRNLDFCRKDVLKLEQFNADVILMVDLLHHLSYQDQEKLLKKIRKIANKNVTVIIKDMDKGKYSFRQLVNYTIDIVCTRKIVFYYRTRKSFLELFQSCRFRVKKEAYINKAYIPLNHILFVLEIAEGEAV